jgi:hypothetical protein
MSRGRLTRPAMCRNCSLFHDSFLSSTGASLARGPFRFGPFFAAAAGGCWRLSGNERKPMPSPGVILKLSGPSVFVTEKRPFIHGHFLANPLISLCVGMPRDSEGFLGWLPRKGAPMAPTLSWKDGCRLLKWGFQLRALGVLSIATFRDVPGTNNWMDKLNDNSVSRASDLHH